MSIIRAPRPESNFYLLDKKIIEDGRLSWAARGMLIYLLGKPDHWKVSITNLRNETADSSKPTGRDGVYAILEELVKVGYIVRQQDRHADGRMGENHYVVSEIPLSDLPLPAKPETDQPLAATATQVSIEDKQELKGARTEEKTYVADATSPDPVADVFDHWRQVMASPRSKLDDKRRKVIRNALKNYSAGDLIAAIDGCRASPWHMGSNDRGQKYNGLDLILRNAEKIDQFMSYASNPPTRAASRNGKPSAHHGLDQIDYASGQSGNVLDGGF